MSEDLKLESITKSYRLMANNHSQGFELNPSINGGVLALSIEYTIRPFSTVYRIAPVFDANSLYGGNYKDSRGLIWQGGFSVAQVNDAWVQYKLQNSTYQEIFNREIKNLEINNSSARALETLNYETARATSNISGGIGLAGSALGGLGIMSNYVSQVKNTNAARDRWVGNWGKTAESFNDPIPAQASFPGMGLAMAGLGAVSSVAALATAQRNYKAAQEAQGINDGLRAESLAYKTDIFNLNNVAIQAQPNTLTTNSDYTILNNTKAYVEVYDCTAEELAYVESVLKYTGMRVDRLGYLKEYLTNSGDWEFIQAIILFVEGSVPNISNAINAELSRGLYIKGDIFNG